jgi:small multidrug resistance pump
MPWSNLDHRFALACRVQLLMKNWAFLTVAILSEVAATSSLKASQGFTKLVPSLIVVAGYVAAFYYLSLTLRSIPVGIAYAIWSGVGVALVALFAWLAYGQKLDVPGIIGIGLIVAGVLVLNLFSKAAAH